MNIKDMVKDKCVTMTRVTNGEIWYSTECGFEFPIPPEDVKGATFLTKDKAILFMRFIRKHLDNLAAAKEDQQVV